MERRLGLLAGVLALLLVQLRMGRLVQTGPDVSDWQLITLSAAMLGGLLWWLIRQTKVWSLLGVTLFVIGGVILFFRVTVPGTLYLQVLPTFDSFAALATEMEETVAVIRRGIPPVFPQSGLVGLLALVMWTLGGFLAQGMAGNSLMLMVTPSAIAYLQFAVLDRMAASIEWLIASTAVAILALSSAAMRRSNQVGRVRDGAGVPKQRGSATATLTMAAVIGLVAVLGTTNTTAAGYEEGNLQWRTGTGGPGIGGSGVAFDRFVDLQQRLLSRENALLFRATLGAGAPPANQIYWTMETLDQFDGTGWRSAGMDTLVYSPGSQIGDPQHAYQGSSAEVLQRVFISRLVGELLPTAGQTTEIFPIDAEGAINIRNIRTAPDHALFYPPGIQTDHNYQILASYPQHNQDLGALATGPDGEFTPMFAAAAEEGSFPYAPGAPPDDLAPPADLERFLDLPADIPPNLRATAMSRTSGATSDFERAWMLQHWFRDSGDFTYSVEVDTGHQVLDLDAWLSDPTSLNYRTGYCEQFAAAMGVLGRLVGIPTRVVWGFTPGSSTTTADNLEIIEVRDINAHAWVEMWMNGIGWVRFDPTPRADLQTNPFTTAFDPTRFLPEGALDNLPPGFIDDVLDPEDMGLIDFEPAGEGFTPVQDRPLYLLLIGPVLLALFAVPLLKKARRARRRRKIRDGDITAAWDEIVDRLTDVGQPISASMTPMEAAWSMDRTLLPIAHSYSAKIYGGRRTRVDENDLINVESWMRDNFDRGKRLKASFNPKSLFK